MFVNLKLNIYCYNVLYTYIVNIHLYSILYLGLFFRPSSLYSHIYVHVCVHTYLHKCTNTCMHVWFILCIYRAELKTLTESKSKILIVSMCLYFKLNVTLGYDVKKDQIS